MPETIIVNAKKHNFKTAKTIKTLRKEKEKLELEDYAKTRSLSNRQNFHDDQTSQTYRKRLIEIKKRLKGIEEEIVKLKSSFVQ